MKKLDLRLFTDVNNDLESRQLHILAALQHAQKQFTLNKIYPVLAELIETRNLLQHISGEMTKMKGLLPQSLKSIDWEKKELIFEYGELPDAQMEQVQTLIEWTLPRLETIIREGVILFEFVEDHIQIRHVGIIPNYKMEGYFFIPDILQQEMALYRYELSLFRHFDDRYRTLKTQFLKRYDESGLSKPLQTIKLELIKEHKDLPNPATYSIKTELDFPFEETILPVVKRLFTIMLTQSQNIDSHRNV